MVQETHEINYGHKSIHQFAMCNSYQKNSSADLGCIHTDFIRWRKQITVSLQSLCHLSQTTECCFLFVCFPCLLSSILRILKDF